MNNKVELIDWYGGDKAIARAAWTSTQIDVESKSDERIRDLLVNKLWNNGSGKPHRCYDDKTEVLTDRGWVLFSELNNEDRVCCVDKDTHNWHFEKPLEIVSYDYNDEMYYIDCKHINLAVTKGHRLLTSKRTEKNNTFSYGETWEVETPELVSGQSRKFLISAKNTNKNILDENHAKLIGFFIGDGSARTSTRISFHLKKERKISYLKSLGYNIEKKKHDTYVINNTSFDFTLCYDKDKNKIIPYDIYTLGPDDVKNILDGMINSDGTKKSRGYDEFIYYTSSPPLIKQLEILACLNNFVLNKHKGNKNCNRFLISHRTAPELCNMPSRKIGMDYWEKYKGKVYCATVTTGFMLVRRNGKPVVCGNTPFERGIVEFNVTCDVASHIHIIKHRHANVNGESARYKELKEDKYLLPQDWGDIEVSKSVGFEATEFTPDGYDNSFYYAYKESKWIDVLEEYTKQGNMLYHQCLEDLSKTLGRKRAKESARFFKTYNSQITLSVMMNMSCFYNFYTLRADTAAQLEIRKIAEDMLQQIKEIPEDPFKYTIEAFGF